MKQNWTREQKHRANRILAVCIAIIAIWVLCIALSIDVLAAFDGERYKTALSVIGALWLSCGLMRVVCWLDKPRR